MLPLLGLGVLAWSGEQNLGSKAWTSIASSSDGGMLVAGVTGGTTGNLWISDNSGATWAEVTPQQGITFNWAAVTSSAGGANLAAVTNPGRIWTSSDYGVSWASPPSVPSAPSVFPLALPTCRRRADCNQLQRGYRSSAGEER